MDRKRIAHDLAIAEEYVRACVADIVRQHEIIAEQQRAGHDTSGARALLQQYEADLTARVSQRDSLQTQLNRLDAGESHKAH